MKHLSQAQLDALVMGLASRGDEAVQRHLATCAECARRLAREARLESELYDVAATVSEDAAVVRARPALARAWRVAVPVAAALAIVAFGAWFHARQGKPGTASPGRSASGALLAAKPCIEDPSRLGPGACVLPPQDVCRYVTVERSRGPSY